METIRLVKNSIKIPLTVLGGAGSLEHVKDLYNKFGLIGCAAGSIFTFKGRFRAVLINYPSQSELLNKTQKTISSDNCEK